MKTPILILVSCWFLVFSLSGCSSTVEEPATTSQSETQARASGAGAANDDAEAHDKALQTMKAMRIIAVTCEAYNVDYGFYPEVDSVKDLGKLVNGVYSPANGIDRKDAWGNKFRVTSSRDSYEIRSLGRDGKLDKHEPSGLTGDLDADIVWIAGEMFVQAPFED